MGSHPTFSVQPLTKSSTSDVDFGAEVLGVDVENLTDDAFGFLRTALYTHNVVLIKGQNNLSPKAQYELTRRFDPAAGTYSHGKSIDKRSILHADLKTILHQPQVQVIGSGFVKSYEGLKNITLVHPHHRKFHRDPIPAEEDQDYTHFYRWHIDSAMYNLDPPRVTSLTAVKVPQGRRQICRYDDGSGEELEVPLGTTAFVSGYRMYELLSEEDKEFVRTSEVEYGAHPYIWISEARSRPNGLGLFSEGRELPDSRLPPVDQGKIRRYPMVWKNPLTGKLALMVYRTPARRIWRRDGSVVEDLETVRTIVYRLQRPGISLRLVYPHDWQEVDLILFNNHGVMHSIVGSFKDDEVRIFKQCNMAASSAPVGVDS
ncbi:TfdA family Taurine catabolism dioxygenase TauD [Botryosphaeria dothidea]|uniref:TfdA family Taurine catabolism dioxygenase TauD n=1 Tax=Botryosphaeria dothidea TaxID=55169 RepID=A0A8H4IK39_9PEZI|nr:TfdA family Taurine catabolism dioxygenase TauD [Botryosphaeria dothidea]